MVQSKRKGLKGILPGREAGGERGEAEEGGGGGRTYGTRFGKAGNK